MQLVLGHPRDSTPVLQLALGRPRQNIDDHNQRRRAHRRRWILTFLTLMLTIILLVLWTIVKGLDFDEDTEPEPFFNAEIAPLPAFVEDFNPAMSLEHPSPCAQISSYVLGAAWVLLSCKFLIS